MALTLAHISDVHLGPIPKGAAWQDFRLKRMIGAFNWRLRRRHFHDNVVANALADDVIVHAPDHIAVTGDMVNLAAAAEFPAAARWLEALGSAERVSFVPGNHDCYVDAPWTGRLELLEPYMAGEMRIDGTVSTTQVAMPFPYVRLRRNVALIGLNTGVPQALFKAGGRLGMQQIDTAGRLLRELREKGYFRCVMIHHPPLPGLAVPRKALADAQAFAEVLAAEGAELVLHGHNHRHMLNRVDGPSGTVPVFGIPAASACGAPGRDPAAWYLHRITREAGRWTLSCTVRGWNGKLGRFETFQEFRLLPETA
ncbi:MAG: metallophosphoesterase family protein [Aestuariivirga sp.]